MFEKISYSGILEFFLMCLMSLWTVPQGYFEVSAYVMETFSPSNKDSSIEKSDFLGITKAMPSASKARAAILAPMTTC